MLSNANRGICVQGTETVEVVPKEDTLALDDVAVTFDGLSQERVLRDPVINQTLRADGTFVLISLSVLNKTHDPQTFNENDGQVRLLIGPNTYTTQDYEAQFGIGERPLLIQQDIQPESEATGFVVFDVPLNRATQIDKQGSGLVILNFKHPGGFEGASEAGFIRLSG